MMSNTFILLLALFALFDVQVATARLGTQSNNVYVRSQSTGHSKVRKAHHSRRHLSSDTGKEIAQQLKIMESFDPWKMKPAEMLGGATEDNGEKKNGSG
mmetsp:Transcript_29386/g.61306  ORF Transcript_29386/g.61306 Transcript_29386/m.61306 type:complete len:99 (-) Transcript_29386:117-413(-)